MSTDDYGDAEDDADDGEQPIPERAVCPECEARPTDESVVEHRLSQLGYHHDDIRLECRECGHRWTLGVPIGRGGEDDLVCDSCGMVALVHRIEDIGRGSSMDTRNLHMKCVGCLNFWQVRRPIDGNDVTLVGYPHITGDQSEADPFGY